MCGTSWPNDHRFYQCPECGENTWPDFGNEPEVSKVEAENVLRYKAFEEYYRKHDESAHHATLERLQSTEPLYPEEIIGER
jgi:hypothetical protein